MKLIMAASTLAIFGMSSSSSTTSMSSVMIRTGKGVAGVMVRCVHWSWRSACWFESFVKCSCYAWLVSSRVGERVDELMVLMRSRVIQRRGEDIVNQNRNVDRLARERGVPILHAFASWSMPWLFKPGSMQSMYHAVSRSCFSPFHHIQPIYSSQKHPSIFPTINDSSPIWNDGYRRSAVLLPNNIKDVPPLSSRLHIVHPSHPIPPPMVELVVAR